MYQSLLHLSWVDNLLDVARALFVKEYGQEVKKPKVGKLDCSAFGQTFSALVAKLDTSAVDAPARLSEQDSTSPSELTPPSSTTGTEDGLDEPPLPPVPAPAFKRGKCPSALCWRARADARLLATSKSIYNDTTSTDATPIPTPDTSRPSSPAINHLLTAKSGPGGRASRRSRKATASSGPASSADEQSPARRPANTKKPSTKQKRRWDADGFAADDDGDETLDYSTQNIRGDDDDAASRVDDVRTEDMGSRTGKGQFVLKDLDDAVDAILAESKNTNESDEASGGLVGSGIGAISGYFRNVVGGKTLAKEDLVKPMKSMEDHLLQKNVAREAAVRLCESVERDLIGLKTSSFTSECAPQSVGNIAYPF